MGSTWSQFFPPAPSLIEANLPNQNGKVFIVTGGYSGVGLELCIILYKAGGKVYLAGRSEEKALDAIARVKDANPSSGGTISFLPLRLDDLTSIKSTVDTFTAAESRLDALFNNAGVSNPPRGSISVQGHELQLATNCLGPHLLTQLLLPTLTHTAATEPAASVRVIWTSSIAVDMSASKQSVDIEEVLQSNASPQRYYEISKVGNWFLADALATQAGPSNILSLVVNPGNLKTALTRHISPWVPFLAAPLLYPARMGAYTELWAGLSSTPTISDGGRYIVPWGRFHPNPSTELMRAMKPAGDGGTGASTKFIKYCDEQISDFK
jgi:NAD(P)-dependent dehydrogenase (short-subunit alcohol dehydrogenase family)